MRVSGRPRGLRAPRLSTSTAWLLLALAGCGVGYPIGAEHARPLVLHDAELDLQCPAKQLRVSEEVGNVFVASGCGRRAKYKANCYNLRCEVHRWDESFVPFPDRPAPGEVPR